MQAKNICDNMDANIVFYNRHTFILPDTEKKDIWNTVEKLLTDNQVEASSHYIPSRDQDTTIYTLVKSVFHSFNNNANMTDLDL